MTRQTLLPTLLAFVLLACGLPTQIQTLGAGTVTPRPTATPTPQPLPPALIEVNPPPGGMLPLDGVLLLTFNQPMDASSTQSALRLTIARGENQKETELLFNWLDEARLEIRPREVLPPDATISLALDATALSQNGLSLLAGRTLTFTTPPPLEVVQMLPKDGLSEVDPTSAIVAVFNQPVVPLGGDPGALPAALRIEPAPSGRGEWVNTSTYIFYPETALYGGADYTVRLNADLRSTSGATLSGEVAWRFTTAPPRLVEIAPQNGSTAVPLDAEIRLRFNQPMDAASVGSNLRISEASGSPVNGSFSWNDDQTVVTFTPASLLQRGKRYAIALPAGTLARGGAPLNTAYAASFTTVPEFALLTTDPLPQGYTNIDRGVTLTFTSPLTEKDLLPYFTLTPTVENLRLWTAEDGEINLDGDFTPLTSYRLTISPDLPDRWGQPLGTAYTLEFETEALEPALIFPSYAQSLFIRPQDDSFPVQAANLSSVEITLGSLGWDEFLAFQQNENFGDFLDFVPEEGQTWTQQLNVPGDRIHTARIFLQPEEGGLPPGIYHLRLNVPELAYTPGPYLLVSSNIQMTLKVSATQVLVWAMDLRTGQPLSNAPVSVYRQEGVLLARGTTDPEGIFLAAISPQKESDVRYFALIGQPGEANFAFTASSWNSGVSSYDFGMITDDRGPHLETYLYTDRPIYRPGQTVSFRAVVRQAYNGRYTPAYLDVLPITLNDPQFNPILETSLPISTFGTAHGAYTLPENAQPGNYRLSTPYGSVWFEVAEYRKPEVNLQVSVPATEILVNENTLNAQVTARYFFDAPAEGLPITWNLYRQRENFSYPGYSVGRLDDHWLYPAWWGYYNSLGDYVASGEARTDAQGGVALELEIPPSEVLYRYTLETTLLDESGYPISARAEWLVHPAPYYIAVRPDAWATRAGEVVNFEVHTVDWARKPVPEQTLTAVFQKVTWKRSDPADPYGLPTFETVYETISRADFRTGPDGVARLAFTAPTPGAYQLEVRGEDGALTQAQVWVGGAGQAMWPNLPNQRLQLTADREAYAPGDTAQVFIPNPFGAGTPALVTVERGAILRHFTLTLDSSGYLLPLELTSEDAPNVYLSVTLLGETANGAPDFRQGYINLPVEPRDFELNVEVTAVRAGQIVSCESGVNCPEHLKPRQEVTFELRVTDAQGAPVQGEFSLAMTDLAALLLADPNSVKITQAFYGQQPLGVRTGLTLARYLGRRFNEAGGIGGGGGGEAMPPFVREEFPDTAYWNPQIVTNAEGRAEVTVTLPDSLTTWQVDVRGLTNDTRVGEAETRLVTSKDLLVRPVTPRFLVPGDHLRIAALVHNNTPADLRVEVALQAAGFTLDDPEGALQIVSIPAGGRAEVAWWGTVEAVPQVGMVFSAMGEDSAGNTYEDLTRPAWGDLPVLAYRTPQTFATAGVLEESGERLELVSLPPSVSPEELAGELEIQLAPSLAAAMTSGLDVLEHYPYECVEQTVSRFLPNLEAYRAIQGLGLEAPDLQARLERTLTISLERLQSVQNEDGGWGWWPGGESDPYISAYVLLGLGRAQQAGVFLNENMVTRGAEYLLATLPTPQMLNQGWQFDRLAFEYYALTQIGYPQAINAWSLYEQRDQLSPWAKALLTLTLAHLRPDDERVAVLLSDLEASTQRTASGAFWEGRNELRNMESTTLNTAIVLLALAQQDPASPTLPQALRYLMAHRDADGSWASTFETSWVLMALTEAMKGTGELAGDFSFSAAVNGTLLVEGRAGGETRLNAVASSLPVERLYSNYANALTLQRGEGPGRLYYTATLKVLRPVEEIAPFSAGISLMRLYYPLSEAARPSVASSAPGARVGDLIEVRLTLNLQHDAYYLLVEDYLPAGAEVLNLNLKSSQQGVEINSRDPFGEGWGWWYFNDPQVYDERIAWTADYLPAGTYELTYILSLNQAGEYRVLPARAWQFYFPEVQGSTAGMVFTIAE